MEKDGLYAPYPQYRPVSRTRGQNIPTLAVHGLAAVGCAFLLKSTWSRIQQFLHIHVATSAPDLYPDTDFPLRPSKEAWDISNSYEYPHQFSRNVTEGTWLRIATHPTKPEIVFDMLGDLYCMNIEIGSDNSYIRPAHGLLTGIPYEKEAEFSPDGSQLVFISDAGFGVDNIWTIPYTSCDEMHRLGSDYIRRTATQQTNSTFRFFSSPSFHPTEPRLLATEWYLTGRPNGVGEIWEFPLLETAQKQLERGGKRLVARKLPTSWSPSQYFESQLGAEQARYSPSGDHVIFTRNVKDDATGKFSYNKDVHAGINAIFQQDLASGRVSELVAAAASLPNKPASPGGANIPRLSRDGRTLAFIRRSNNNEVLALKDMRSGTVHYAWDGLEYDLSTIPAFMGAYPNYGWTNNDTAIVIWSQGQIWRVELKLNERGERVAKETPTALEFQAQIDMKLANTRYSETRIKDGELAHSNRIRAFRGLRSNFAGDEVVFEAAGDNYVADTAGGVVRAVPKPAPDQSCYAPSFARDSTFILQACWDETEMTTFHVADVDTGNVEHVQGLPRGRYVSPVTNGTLIAYVRTGKDYMFGDVEETFGQGIWLARLHIDSEGLYVMADEVLLDISGTTAETKLDFLNEKHGSLLRVQTGGTVTLYNLETQKLLARVASGTATEMTFSSSSTVAFRDFQHVWLSAGALPNTLDVRSKPLDSRTPSDLIRLSQIGGHDVTISGDGKKVFWLLGSSLSFANISQVMKTCYRASTTSRDIGSCLQPYVRSLDLNVTYETILGRQASQTGGKNFAIFNATVVSMDDLLPRELRNGTVIMRNGQITAVGPSEEIRIPSNSEILDVRGGVVMPGFIDVHGHWGGFLTPYPLRSWEMETFLGYGVTTIHNPASHNVFGPAERARIEKGRMYGPRVFVTGDVLYGSTQPSVYTEINSREDARDALLRIKLEGGHSSFSAKNYQLAARSARQRLLLEAKDLSMLIVPEGGWSFDWGLTYFIDGYTTHEHPLPIPNLYDDVISLIEASGSSYTPLAVMNYGGIFGQHWVHQTVNIPADPKLRKYVRHDILESLTEVKQAPKSSYQFFNTSRSTARLAERGVRTNVGAHGEQPIGLLYHWEMRMMEMGGQDAYSILRHATIGSAVSLGLQESLGSIEVGKLADLVIYPPGVDSVERLWESSMDMKYVVRGGTVFDVVDGLRQVWP